MKVWLSKSQDGVGIPYPAGPLRKDGSQNHGYSDLKRDSRLIRQVPELKDAPELRQLVEVINSPQSLLRTLGCEKAFGKSDSPSFRKELVSFLRIAFDVLAWNQNPENYQSLYRAFEEFVGDRHADSGAIGVEFVIEPASFLHHGINGWSVTLWNYGYGKDDAAARRNWALGVRLLEEFFIRHNREINPEAYKDETRIS